MIVGGAIVLGTRTRGASFSDGSVSLGLMGVYAAVIRWKGGFGSTWLVDDICQVGREHQCTSFMQIEAIYTEERNHIPRTG